MLLPGIKHGISRRPVADVMRVGSTYTNMNQSGNDSIHYPSDVEPGDICFLSVGYNNSSNYSAPSGWSWVYSITNGDRRATLGVRVIDGSEPSSFILSSGTFYVAAMQAARGWTSWDWDLVSDGSAVIDSSNSLWLVGHTSNQTVWHDTPPGYTLDVRARYTINNNMSSISLHYKEGRESSETVAKTTGGHMHLIGLN